MVIGAPAGGYGVGLMRGRGRALPAPPNVGL
jgi:hypothetical protein